MHYDGSFWAKSSGRFPLFVPVRRAWTTVEWNCCVCRLRITRTDSSTHVSWCQRFILLTIYSIQSGWVSLFGEARLFPLCFAVVKCDVTQSQMEKSIWNRSEKKEPLTGKEGERRPTTVHVKRRMLHFCGLASWPINNRRKSPASRGSLLWMLKKHSSHFDPVCIF